MPEISQEAEYLVALLHSAGYASATGMGMVGFTWQEIEAWARCSDYVGILAPRELRAVFQLSRAYANELAKATKKDAKPPYVPKAEKITEEDREAISKHADDLFASLMNAQKRD